MADVDRIRELRAELEELEAQERDELRREDVRETIEQTIEDLVSRFVYYDRKEDETLQRGDIERAVKRGAITIDAMVERFRESLTASLAE